jgi:hypothetical protein
MAVSNVSVNPPASSSLGSILGNVAAPFVNDAKSSTEKQASAVVTLSAQGQKLSQSAPSQTQTSQTQTNQSQTSSRTDTVATENVEPQSKERVEPAGIQFMEGESKGGRVNTYA